MVSLQNVRVSKLWNQGVSQEMVAGKLEGGGVARISFVQMKIYEKKNSKWTWQKKHLKLPINFSNFSQQNKE